MADPTITKLLVSDAIVAIRSGTAHDNDTQTTDTQITGQLDRSLKRLRRRLSAAFPSIFETVSASIVVAAGASTITKPVDCEHVTVLEKQNASGYWDFLDVNSSLNRSAAATLSFYERDGSIILDPAYLAAGTYRIHYSQALVDGYTSIDLPAGLEEIVIEEVCAWVRQRHEEDPSYHLMRARQVWDENWMPLKKRYGAHGRSSLQITRP